MDESKHRDFAYAPASTHENTDGLRARFARVKPDWNRRPAHLESRVAARARIARTDDSVQVWFGRVAT